MGSVIKNIEIEGQSAVAPFDTGAVYTYGRELLLRGVARKLVVRPVRVVLGGRMIEVREVCTVDGKIEGLDFFIETVPVGELGMADGLNWTSSSELGRWDSGRFGSIPRPAA